MSRWAVATLSGALAMGGPVALAAQTGLVISVVDSASRAPVYGAVVRSLRLARAARTDDLGRARFATLPRPDTLVVAAVGFRPETLTVAPGLVHATVRLERLPLTLPEVTVTREGETGLAPSVTGQWVLPRQVVANVPPAIEADPLRALAIVPSVSFSTPLSARPVIRGYDALESVVRVDGFEILNPYHLGRIFGAFPADATEAIVLAPQPARAADGGTLAGVVDLRGRASGAFGGPRAGLDLSLISAAGWWGTRGAAPAFVAARGFWFGPAARLFGVGVPYNFQDIYAQAAVPIGGNPRLRWSLFASRDDFGKVGLGTGARWSTVLLGQRARVVDRPAASVDFTASAERFAIEASDIDARTSSIDIVNRFSRVAAGIEGGLRRGELEISVGATVAARRISNSLSVDHGDDFMPTARATRLTEVRAFVDGRWERGHLFAAGGLRVDASRTARSWQPRARVGWELGEGITAAFAAARASRLYQLVTDPQPEPTVAFYDFWLNAGEAGVPTPRVDHLSLELDYTRRSWSVRGALFASWGAGLGELRPVTDQRANLPAFRYGDSRTRGVELRAARRAAGPVPAVVASYVWSGSERRWDEGVWRPWRLDRRHILRLQLEEDLGRWHLFGVAEFLSGQPITPVAEVVRRQFPPVPGDSAPRANPLIDYLYAAEGSARSAGTFHFDLGARARFGGPGRSRFFLGLSVINLTFGPVAPEVPVPPEELIRPDGTYPGTGVAYRRLFNLPAVPSATLRIEF